MATAIQFLRSREPSVRPNPVELSDGMPMVNIHESEPGLYFKLTNNKLAKIGPPSIGSVAPNSTAPGYPGNARGEMWLDTSEPAVQMKVYDGAGWLSVTTSPAGNDTEIQFNDKGAFGADPDLNFDGVILSAPQFKGDGSLLTNLNVPGSLTFRGDCNVSQPAPTASTGDYFLNVEPAVAVPSWTGIAGQNVAANQFIYYTVDSVWVLGAIQDSQGLVTVAGAQVITGAKTFTATMVTDDVTSNSIAVQDLVVSLSATGPLTQSTDEPETLVTKSYVDYEVQNSTYWDRIGTTLTPSEAGDNVYSEGNVGVGGSPISPVILLDGTGEMTVNGSSDLRGSLTVDSDTDIGGSLEVTGDASCATITATTFDIDSLPALF